MAVRAGDLRDRIEVAIAGPVKDEHGETSYDYAPLRTIWGSVSPSSGRSAELPGEAERAEITHRVVIRERSLPEICLEMRFTVRGQVLEVRYWYPIYNRRGWLEVFCRLVQGERGMQEVQADGA